MGDFRFAFFFLSRETNQEGWSIPEIVDKSEAHDNVPDGVSCLHPNWSNFHKSQHGIINGVIFQHPALALIVIFVFFRQIIFELARNESDPRGQLQ
jgi:hypothetical protein